MGDPELRVHLNDEAIRKSFEDGSPEHIYIEMWRAGFVRVSSAGEYMYFEGYPKSMASLYRKAKDMAESAGRKAVFEKR